MYMLKAENIKKNIKFQNVFWLDGHLPENGLHSISTFSTICEFSSQISLPDGNLEWKIKFHSF